MTLCWLLDVQEVLNLFLNRYIHIYILGPLRESNPRPPRPKRGIIPLDQAAFYIIVLFLNMFSKINVVF